MRVLGDAAWLAGLAFFYWKYVPLVGPFQAALGPLLLVVMIAGWLDPRRGALLFLALFPLINSLPYFFGMYEPLPLAPTALVLFLFFSTGILLRGKLWSEDRGAAAASLPGIRVWAALVTVSAVVTFFRYANGFPLRTLRIYELKTNVIGVSAGGAIMSVVFQALNYLTAIAFFFLILRLFDGDGLGRAARVIAGSAIAATGWALVQKIWSPALGNNPTTVAHALVNGTLKDAMSLGAFASMIGPFAAGALLAARPLRTKALFAAAGALALAGVFLSGSKIAIFGLAVSILAAGFGAAVVWGKTGADRRRAGALKWMSVGLLAMLVLAGILIFARTKSTFDLGTKSPLLVERFANSKYLLHWRLESQWKPALKMAARYPLTGVGVGAFAIEADNVTDIYRKTGSTPESAENHLLQILAELGGPGVLLALGIGFALVRRIWIFFRRLGPAEPSGRGFLVAGASAGILAFAINGTMHTYAGSFEIKYLLWFLIAFVVALTSPALGGKTAEPQEPGGKGGTMKPARPPGFWMAAGAVALFAAVHGWNSAHSLSLESRTKEYGVVQEFGLGKIEKTTDGREFRWSREYAGIPIKLAQPVMTVPIQAAHPDIARKPITVTFTFVQGLFRSRKVLKRVTLADNEWRDIDLPAGGEIGRDGILLIEVDRTWVPQKVQKTPDPRSLGVAVGRIVFKTD